MFTSHGHQIKGTTVEDRPEDMKVARCGGPGLCAECSREAASLGEIKTRPESVDNLLRAKLMVMVAYNEGPVQGQQRGPNPHHGFELKEVPPVINTDDIYVVWYCYILGGWKALLSTTVPDDKYYEVTYNVVAGEAYLDVYKKQSNQKFEAGHPVFNV